MPTETEVHPQRVATDYAEKAAVEITEAISLVDLAIATLNALPSIDGGWQKYAQIRALARARQSLVEAAQELP